jgi:hypothetical protein
MQQFKSFITYPTDSKLVESEGTKRALGRVNVVDNSTVPPLLPDIYIIVSI